MSKSLKTILTIGQSLKLIALHNNDKKLLSSLSKDNFLSSSREEKKHTQQQLHVEMVNFLWIDVQWQSILLKMT